MGASQSRSRRHTLDFMASQVDEAALYSAFDAPPDATVAFLSHIAQSAGLGPQVRVLDMGCGPGRLLAPLAGLGWTVHGVEPDPAYRAFAQERTLNLPGVSVSAGSLQSLEMEACFDLAIAVNSVFNHLLGRADRADALTRTYRALVPTGLLVLDLANFPWILDHFAPPQPRTAELAGRTVTLTHRHEINLTELTFTTYQEFSVADDAGAVHVSKPHVYAIVEQAALLEEIRAAGFEDIRTFRGWTSRASDTAEGARILAVAARPGR
jgi:SAM-dependent methyltransferase